MTHRYDLVVLGGGTAGLVSALIAAGVGARVALVERERVGGDCLWTGCVPSKSLLAAAQLAHRMRHADAVGLPPHDPDVDFAAVMGHVQRAIRTIEPQDSPDRLRRAGVEVVEAEGAFEAPGVLRADGRILRWRRALVATGSAPALPPVPGLDGVAPLTSETVWDLRERPPRLAILGGGPIGCELGQAFHRLGSAVTLVEAGPRVLDKEEPRASALVAAVLREEGVDVRLGAEAVGVDADDHGERPGARRRRGSLRLAGGAAVGFDALFVATGRAPRTGGIGLEALGVALDDRGAVRVDGRLRTANPAVYAAGDVTGQLPFTHVAAHHARVATPNALFGLRRSAGAVLPWATFTDPEVGRVGLTEAQARERWGDRAQTAAFDYAELDRAVTGGEARGFALLVGDPRGRLVGATVAAPGGGEAVAALTAFMRAGAKLDDVSETVHAYPTLAEGPSRAATARLAERWSRPAVRRGARPVLAALRALRRPG